MVRMQEGILATILTSILLAANFPEGAISGLRRNVACVASELSLKHDITVSLTVKQSAQFHKNIEVLPFYKNIVEEGLRYEPQ